MAVSSMRHGLRNCFDQPALPTLALAITLVLAVPSNAAAQSGPALEHTVWFFQWGTVAGTDTFTVGAVREWPWQLPLWGGVLLAQTELSLGHWRSHLRGQRHSLTQAGMTPSVRYYWQSAVPTGWFTEAGVGINYITPRYQREGKEFSTRWNFGDHLAFGHRSAGKAEHEWSVRVQHYSNGGIESPNPGENFFQLRYARAF